MKKILLIILFPVLIYSQSIVPSCIRYAIHDSLKNSATNTLDRISTQLASVYTKAQIDAMVLNLQSQINELYERLGNLNPTIPQPVTNLAVNTIYNDSIKYSFTNPTSNFDSIQFWGRNTVQGGLQFTRVGKVDSGLTTWTWKNLIPNYGYELYAIAYDGVTPSLSSNIVDATTSYTSIYYLSVVSPYNFGILDSTAGGSADTTLTILVTNNNDVDIDISGITGASSPFTVHSYSATIAAKGTGTISIVIDRNKAAGIYSSTLTIATEFTNQTLGLIVTIQKPPASSVVGNTFDYYVSANGTGNGLSPSTPMSFASFLSTNLVAGDTVGFKNGDLFRLTGYYTINDNNVCLTNWKASGTTDTRPRFYKSTDVLGTSGWTNTGTNRWSRTVSVATTGTQLFFRNADHTSKRGYKQTNATDVDVPYEWHTTGTVLTVYSPTATNPTVYYENIERIANNEYRGFTISATGVTLDSLEICYGYSDQIEITNGNGRNTVKYCEIHNAGMGSEDGGDGIYCKSTYNYFGYNKIYENAVHNIYCQSYSGGNSGYNTIEFNEVFNTYHTNIDIMNDAVGKTNNGNQVRYNIVYDNANKWNPTFESIGIQVQGYLGTGTAWCYGNKVYGNLIYGQRGISINIQSYADSVYIYNNTIHYSTIQTAIVVEEAASVSPKANVWISNNLLVSMTGSNWWGLFVSSGTNKHIGNNGFYDSNGGNIAQVNGTNYTTLSAWQSAGWGTGDVWANPLFTDYANNDFTLQAGSPMKNTGATLGGAYNNSLNGVTRPVGAGWDIGAYEQ